MQYIALFIIILILIFTLAGCGSQKRVPITTSIETVKNGEDGKDGTNGINGEDGLNGSNGFNSLIVMQRARKIKGCRKGGVILKSGLDLDRNGVLEDHEVTSKSFLCDRK